MFYALYTKTLSFISFQSTLFIKRATYFHLQCNYNYVPIRRFSTEAHRL